MGAFPDSGLDFVCVVSDEPFMISPLPLLSPYRYIIKQYAYNKQINRFPRLITYYLFINYVSVIKGVEEKLRRKTSKWWLGHSYLHSHFDNRNDTLSTIEIKTLH